MIDTSEKRNRRLASELQNSHVCEKFDPNLRSTVVHSLQENALFFPQDEKYSVLRFSSWYFSLT